MAQTANYQSANQQLTMIKARRRRADYNRSRLDYNRRRADYNRRQAGCGSGREVRLATGDQFEPVGAGFGADAVAAL